jgi:prophage regulatory protein
VANTILRLPAVKARTGLSRSTIYLRVADGTFPHPVSLGARAVGWVESEIEEWISRKIRQSRSNDCKFDNREER